MSNQFLKLRRSAVPGKRPDTGSLDLGEIALNTHDGLAFMKKSGSLGEQIIVIGDSTGSFTGSFNGEFTGSLLGTASWAINAVTASTADDFFVRGNITGSNGLITGTLTTQTLVVQTISSSIIYSSGSNIFGDELTDTQQFTGSVTVTGSLALNGDPVITQIPYNAFSSSIQLRATKLEATASILTAASASLAVDSGSNSIRLTNLEATSSIVSASYASASGSLSIRVTNLEATSSIVSASYASASGSLSTRVTNLEATSSIVSASYASASGSLSTRVTTLEQASASFAQDSGSNSIRLTNLETTASVLTVASASFAIVSASYAELSGSFRTGSYTGSFFGTAELVDSELSGSTQITGSLGVTGSVSISGSLGSIFSANVDTIIFSGSLYQSGSIQLTGSLDVLGGITGSLFGTASWAITASHAPTALTASHAITASNALTASTADNFYVRQDITASNALINGTLTATTIVAQYITASTEFITGSTKFGTLLTNTHQFTGSVTITGSLSLNDDPVVTQTPYNIFSSSIQSRVVVLENASASFAQQSGSNSIRFTNLESTASILTSASASLAQDSGSNSIRLTNLESTSSIVSASYALASGSLSIRVTNLESTSSIVSASYASASGSLSTRVTNLESTASILTTASASFAVVSASYASASGSLSTRVTTLEQASASFAQDSGSNSIRLTNLETTASVLTTASASFAIVSASYASASGSLSIRTTNLETTASVLTSASASFAQDSGSNSVRLTNLESTASVLTSASASFASDSGSNSIRLTNLETTASVLTVASASFAVVSASYASASGSLSTRVTTLENASASFAQDSGSNSIRFTNLESTASVLTSASASFAQQSGSNSIRLTNLETTASILTVASASFAVVSASYAELSGSFRTGSYTGSFTGFGDLTGSLYGTASWALNAITASHAPTALTASHAITADTASSADNFFVRQDITASNALIYGTLTAQTVYAQYITASTEFITGSTKFGTQLTDTHQFTGSVTITGSLSLNNDPVVTQGPYNIFSQSIQLRATNLEATASILTIASASFAVVSASYASASGSLSTRVTTLENASASFAQDSGSNSIRLTNLESTASVLTTASASFAIVSASYASASGSLSTRVTTLENASASFAQDSGSNSIRLTNLESTASVLTTASASFALVSASYAELSGSFRTGSYTGSFTGVGFLTGSLYGTASWAISSSYSQTSTSASYAITASNSLTASYSLYALTASYAENIVVSGSITDVDYIDFDTSVAYTLAEGRLGWDSGEGTLQLGLEGGNVTYALGEQIYQYVYNAEATTMTKGQVVYVSGSQGNKIAVKLANDSGDPSSAGTLGLVAETIASGGNGWVITEGPLRKLNTIGLTAGKLLFLGSTPGTYTETPPTAPSHSVRLGYVERISATVGSIYVKIDNGYEIGELHDVVDNTTTGSYGDLFVKSGSVWISSKQLTGSYGLTGSLQATSFTGSLFGTASYAINADLLDGKDSSVFATTGSNIFVGNQTVTGSLFTSGSNTLVGSTTLTGSLNITGSTVQIGNNTLLGNTTLSGSIIISGTLGSTPSVKIYGDTQHNGYIRFDPVTTNIDTSISASYIFVSGSTNDLYFSQNGSGYSNVTRLRWLEGNLYTGLLNGGLITSQSSTTYQVGSGSGIIVNLNASLNDNPYPTTTYVNWPNLTGNINQFSASYDQTFVAISSTGTLLSQSSAFLDGQVDTQIPVGSVLHQNNSTINGTVTEPSLAYGWKQRSNIFISAFGPLKLSGFNLAVSGSSTGSLVVGSGTAFLDGGNYQTDPNNPSYVTATGTSTSRIFRYYESGSDWIYDTNGGVGYGAIDPARYSNNGVLTSVGAGNWSIQRVFFFPTSPLSPKPIVVYYGNAVYPTEAEAIANVPFEAFTEAPSTAATAIYLGAIVISGNGLFTSPTTFTIYPGGLFRQVGGSGGGGSIVTQTLAGLSDVNISGPTNYQALVYDTNQLKWINASFVSASISGNAATATSASFSSTASFALNVPATASYALQALSSSFASTASFALNVPATASYALQALSSSFATTASYALNAGAGISSISIADEGVLIGTASFFNFVGNNISASVSNSTASITIIGSTGTAAFTQSVAAPTWSFVHNLNTITPIIQVYTSTYNQIIPNEIVGITSNLAEIRFDYSQSGYAIASNGGSLTVSGSTARLNQTTPAVTWSFNHGLNSQYVNFEVYDSSNFVIIPAGIKAVDSNNAELYFATPTSGTGIAMFSGINGAPNAATASYATYAVSASYSDAFYIDQTLTDYATVASSVNGSNTIFNIVTGSYTSAFFRYTVASASNARSGEVISVWNGTSTEYVDNSTLDLGTTNAVTSSVVISGANVQFNVQTNTAGWKIKSIATFM